MNKSCNRITGVDIFTGVNVLLFFWMCGAVYYDRFIYYRGHGHLQEFFVYAVAILMVIAAAWKCLRHRPVPTWILTLVQAGIVMHFAGGLALWQEARLYDAVFFNIRYDKYVHFVNSFICGWILYFLYFRSLAIARWLKEFQQIFGVLGIGAVVEIMEYLVTLTVIHNGVGGYDNNMQDMIANFAGSVFCIFVIRLKDRIVVNGPLTDTRAIEW